MTDLYYYDYVSVSVRLFICVQNSSKSYPYDHLDLLIFSWIFLSLHSAILEVFSLGGDLHSLRGFVVIRIIHFSNFGTMIHNVYIEYPCWKNNLTYNIYH